jgi:hypothetical protein
LAASKSAWSIRVGIVAMRASVAVCYAVGEVVRGLC